MHSNGMTGWLLGAVVLFACAASSEGVDQARQWQYQADVARAGGMDAIAYRFYRNVAEVFPNTPHGRSAAVRAAQMRGHLLWVDRSPASEDPESFLGEAIDFLVWP